MAYDGEPIIEDLVPATVFVDDISPESQDEHTAPDSLEIMPDIKEGEDVQD